MGGYPSEHVIRFVAGNYYEKTRAETRILDFGCGAGSHTWYLAREGFDTYAFDGSPYAVENARKKLEEENLNADFLNGPLHNRGVCHFYRKEDLEKLLSETGFKDITVDVILYSDNGKVVQQYVAQAVK